MLYQLSYALIKSSPNTPFEHSSAYRPLWQVTRSKGLKDRFGNQTQYLSTDPFCLCSALAQETVTICHLNVLTVLGFGCRNTVPNRPNREIKNCIFSTCYNFFIFFVLTGTVFKTETRRVLEIAVLSEFYSQQPDYPFLLCKLFFRLSRTLGQLKSDFLFQTAGWPRIVCSKINTSLCANLVDFDEVSFILML